MGNFFHKLYGSFHLEKNEEDLEVKESILLLAHLIPCCQYFQVDGTYKTKFEETMDHLMEMNNSDNQRRKEEFWAWLFKNVANRGLNKKMSLFEDGSYKKT